MLREGGAVVWFCSFAVLLEFRNFHALFGAKIACPRVVNTPPRPTKYNWIRMPYPSHIPICDPHFHVWDNQSNPKNLNLGGIADGPLGVYLTKDIKAATQTLPYVSGVHVETVVGQKEGGFPIDTVAETRFVLKDIAGFGGGAPFGISAYVHLGREDAGKVIGEHVAAGEGKLVGVRMILNYSAEDASLTWPQVDGDSYLQVEGGNPHFGPSLGLLAAKGLVYDLHANWWQLERAAAKFTSLPPGSCPTVVLDHLGCPKLASGSEEEDAKRVAVWKAGMTSLAGVPQVNIKISGLEYVHGGWLVKGSKAWGVVKDCVYFVLDTFGTQRCMVASNNPVDLAMGGKDFVDLYAGLYDLLSEYPRFEGKSEECLKALFHDNAFRVYNLARLSSKA